MRSCGWITLIIVACEAGGAQAFSLQDRAYDVVKPTTAVMAASRSPLFRSVESLSIVGHATDASITRRLSPLGAAASSSSSSVSSAGTPLDEAPDDSLARQLQQRRPSIAAWKATLTKYAMMLYIVGMCIALPVTLIPQRWLHQLGLIDRRTKEAWALSSTTCVSRWLLRLVPFCRLNVIPAEQQQQDKDKLPDPSIWVCNHTSMLDVFLLLAADYRLRGANKRPIKIVYWKGLESNFVTKLMFTQAGFIAVEMEDNGNGNDNAYDRKTFKKLLKDCKQAFEEGYDVGLMPEGQPNPYPEQGMLPIFSGAYTLAKMSRRPIQLMALHGAHHLWPATEGNPMDVTGRTVTVRCYPDGRVYSSPEEFKATVQKVIGHFGATGQDLAPKKLKGWLTGATWQKQQEEKAAAELKKKQVAEMLKKQKEEEEEREKASAVDNKA